MTQPVTEQVLIVLHARRETERAKRRPPATRYDTPTDQELNEMVMERPPRLVASCPGEPDHGYHVVDHCARNCERGTVFCARNSERHRRRVDRDPPQVRVGSDWQGPPGT